MIKEDNLPPSRWKLGRIIKTLPGPDGLVRSVFLKTATGMLKRPIVKLALLESHEEEEQGEGEIQDHSSGGSDASNIESLGDQDDASSSNSA